MKTLRYLKDLWDESQITDMDEPEILRYRSNLLGSDLRITNFGGGNTSSKVTATDPLSASPCDVLWVKGSGGDLGSIKRSGFATLYMDKVLQLEGRYRGVEHEDEMVGYYPLCTFGHNATAASIDTPLHAYLPFRHVDHLHPDWGIALAASANAAERLKEFNEQFGHRVLWLPWQRPGFELGLMLRDAVGKSPDADGLILGSHGLFTWGNSQRECYLSTLHVIDDLGEFVHGFIEQKGKLLFGDNRFESRDDRRTIATDLLPLLRGRLSAKRRLIGHYSDAPDVMRFVNSADAKLLAQLGTSCPDHFVRTKIQPLVLEWDSQAASGTQAALLDAAIAEYRETYAAYYKKYAQPDSPAMRDAAPTVVLVPGIGMFSFGKNKTEARVTGEFYTNAIHVMEGATTMSTAAPPKELPQAGSAASTNAFTVHENYVALPYSEAFRIEYWLLEEAKLQRQPAEKRFSRQIFVVVGGANGIGRAVAEAVARDGAHVVIADYDASSAAQAANEIAKCSGKETVLSVGVDIRKRESVAALLEAVSLHFGGIDALINTAAIFPVASNGSSPEEDWRRTMDVNVTANYILADEAHAVLSKQGLRATIILTSSANAVVPKRGSEAYDVSKAAVSHLVRELAVSFGPLIRVNGIAPATVVKGSSMFPRDRVIASLSKYGIPFDASATEDELRSQLSGFYAQRTITHEPIEPADCAEAILFLASDRARCTTGHIFPVDGGLPEAFLR